MKKGLTDTPVVLILGIAVIAIVLGGVIKGSYEIARREFRTPAPFDEEAFIPYKVELDPEEQRVFDSMSGLITAINAIADKETVNLFQDTKIKAKDIPFHSYTISFSGRAEIEEDGINDVRDWTFARKFTAKTNDTAPVDHIIAQNEEFVWADYEYYSCDNDNEGSWVPCAPERGKKEKLCYCNDEDDIGNGYGEMKDLDINKKLINGASIQNIAPIRDLQPVANIELITFDENGKVLCKAGTYEDTVADDIDNKKKDLLVWGSTDVESCPSGNPSSFRKGDGCDRDGDGIQGAYGPRFHGKLWEDVVPKNKRGLVSDKDIARYFPIEAAAGNGEGCLDSPTWVECPGVRIYFCGKLGLKSNAGGDKSQYYFRPDENGKVHSNAGIKVLRIFSEKFKKHQSSNSRKDNEKSINIRDAQAGSFSSWAAGAARYAQETDLGIVLAAVGGLTGNVFSLSMKTMEDPNAYCETGGAIKINEGPTSVKCDPRLGTCGVCEFELPQKTSADENSAFHPANWFSGYGDPKYVVYYEGFPYGEEDAWQIQPAELALGSIVAWNIGATVVPFGVVKAGKFLGRAGKLTAAITGKTARVIDSAVFGGRIATFTKVISKFGKKGVAPVLKVSKAGKQVVKAISFPVRWPVTKVRDLMRSGVKYVKQVRPRAKYAKAIQLADPTIYTRTYKEADNILRYVDKPTLEKVFKASDMDDIAEAAFKLDDLAFDARWAFKNADPADLRKLMPKEQADQIIKLLDAGNTKEAMFILDAALHSDEAIEILAKKTNLKPSEVREIIGNTENPADLRLILGDVFPKKDVDKLMEAIDAAYIDEAAEQILKDADVLKASNTFVDRMKLWQPRNWDTVRQKGQKYGLAMAAGYAMAKADSMDEKFLPIGSNAVGIKKPYAFPFVSGEQLPALSDNANKYYVSLMKDKFKGGGITETLFDQNNERFYMASPCVSNLALIKTSCDCWDIDDEDENGNPTVEAVNFGAGLVHVPKYSINDDETDPKKKYGHALKMCRDRTAGLTSVFADNPVYETECVMVNPVLKGDTFCYSGQHTLAEIGKWGTLAGTVGGSIAISAASDSISAVAAGSIVGLPLVPLIQGAEFVANVGLDVIGFFVERTIDEETQWPNH